MAGDRGISSGANARPLDDTMGETGPGIPDDAVLDGELGPGEIGAGADEAVAALEKSGWAPRTADGSASDAEAESEAHPS